MFIQKFIYNFNNYCSRLINNIFIWKVFFNNLLFYVLRWNTTNEYVWCIYMYSKVYPMELKKKVCFRSLHYSLVHRLFLLFFCFFFHHSSISKLYFIVIFCCSIILRKMYVLYNFILFHLKVSLRWYLLKNENKLSAQYNYSLKTLWSKEYSFNLF